MLDPIVKHYYKLFTGDSKKAKLEILKDYLKMNLGMRQEIATQEKNSQLYFVANITALVVDEEDTGYALLDVQAYDNMNSAFPFQMFADIGIIDKGVLHTWYPYDKVSYFDYAQMCEFKIMYIHELDTYITDKALDFAQRVCKDPQLWNSIASTTPNGAYTTGAFQHFCQETRKQIAKYDELEKAKVTTGQEALSFVDIIDAYGLDVDNPEPEKPVDTVSIIPEEEVIIDAEFIEKPEEPKLKRKRRNRQ